jgi:hypothetical protein
MCHKSKNDNSSSTSPDKFVAKLFVSFVVETQFFKVGIMGPHCNFSTTISASVLQTIFFFSVRPSFHAQTQEYRKFHRVSVKWASKMLSLLPVKAKQ